jgi:hypothetical protein
MSPWLVVKLLRAQRAVPINGPFLLRLFGGKGRTFVGLMFVGKLKALQITAGSGSSCSRGRSACG